MMQLISYPESAEPSANQAQRENELSAQMDRTAIWHPRRDGPNATLAGSGERISVFTSAFRGGSVDEWVRQIVPEDCVPDSGTGPNGQLGTIPEEVDDEPDRYVGPELAKDIERTSWARPRGRGRAR